ncbi:hypothetical protein ACOMHN_036120 [Nucella lapillus]
MSMNQHPAPSGDVSDGKQKAPKHTRIASTASRTSPTSWRHTPYYSRSAGGSRLEDRVPISGEQLGMKVRISFVDNSGRVKRSPRSAQSSRTLTTTPGIENGFDDIPGYPEGTTQGLSGWGSSMSITSLPGTGRPYRPRSFVSSRDKILSSVLDKYFMDSPGQRHNWAAPPCSQTEDDAPLNTSSFSATSMPSLPTSRPQLTATSTPTASPPPPSLLPRGKTSSPDAGQSGEMFAADSVNSDSNTPRSTTSNPSPNPHTSFTSTSSPTTRHLVNGIHASNGKVPTTTTPVTNGIRAGLTSTMTQVKGPAPASNKPRANKILNGIHAKGQGPTSSEIMNGVVKGPTSSEIMNGTLKDKNEETAGPKNRYGTPLLHRDVANNKRVHFSLSVLMKEHVRNMYMYRHVVRATDGAGGGGGGGRGGGGWQGTGRSVARAYGRLRGRRRTVQSQTTTSVERDENASPPVSRMFRKFRMVGILTVTLIRLKAAIVVNSLDRTERSASEIQWRTLYGQQEAEKLAFSKSYYARERIITKMPRWALEIFDIMPEERTESDCRRLHALFRGMRSFDKFTEEIQLNLCRSFLYSCVEESRILLRRGHIGHNFYFVYSGSVFVNVPDTDSEGEIFIKTEAILAHGDSFGELALLKDILRTATVSVRETCELLVVDKDVFSHVCPKIFEKELMEKKSFISHMSLFSPKWWTADALSSLCLEAQIQEYKINKIVVENSTTEEWMYICMEGKCQVIRCLSGEGEGEEEEEEEEANRSKLKREQSVILSDEILELLSSSRVGEDKPEKTDADNSKQKLLASLGLEYAETYKRNGPFLEEVEEEERRKAFLASTGPMTLTSLMAQQEEEGKTGLVYVKVGTLEAEEVFDVSSLIKPPVPRVHSGLLLVSCGARMLRVKKSLFLKLASSQAIEHTRAVVSKHPFPSEGAIVESYKRKVTWNAYKAQVVNDVVRVPDQRNSPRFRSEKKKEAQRTDPSPLDRGQTPKKPLPALSSPRVVKTPPNKDSTAGGKNKDGASEDSSDLPTDKMRQSGGKKVTIANAPNDTRSSLSNSKDDKHVSGLKRESRNQVRARIFPIVEVDPHSESETPRPDSATSSEDSSPRPPPVPISLQQDVGPGPEAVIVRRRSSLGFNLKPSVSVDTTFVTRRHQSRDVSSGHMTRFNLTNETATVVENA